MITLSDPVLQQLPFRCIVTTQCNRTPAVSCSRYVAFLNYCKTVCYYFVIHTWKMSKCWQWPSWIYLRFMQKFGPTVMHGSRAYSGQTDTQTVLQLCIRLVSSMCCRLTSAAVAHSHTTAQCYYSTVKTLAWHGRWWRSHATPLISVVQCTQMAASTTQVLTVNGDLLSYLSTLRWQPSKHSLASDEKCC